MRFALTTVGEGGLELADAAQRKPARLNPARMENRGRGSAGAAVVLGGSYFFPQPQRLKDSLKPCLDLCCVDPVGETLATTAPVLHP